MEDDVELLNGDIFDKYITVASQCGYYHMSVDERWRYFGNEDKIDCSEEQIGLYDYGSASFNYFSKEGIEKVGGFHTEFSKSKRFGHTEHTYRFVNANLHDRAFITIEDCFENYCQWHNPPSVTDPKDFEKADHWLAQIEQNIIDQKLTYYPIKTISAYHCNEYSVGDTDVESIKLISALQKKIFLLEKEDRNLRQSKSFRLGNLFFRSMKDPYKFIAFPFNVIKLLFLNK